MLKHRCQSFITIKKKRLIPKQSINLNRLKPYHPKQLIQFFFLIYQHLCLVNGKLRQTSAYIPSAYTMYEIIHWMNEIISRNTYHKRQEYAWHPLGSRLYFGIQKRKLLTKFTSFLSLGNASSPRTSRHSFRQPKPCYVSMQFSDSSDHIHIRYSTCLRSHHLRQISGWRFNPSTHPYTFFCRTITLAPANAVPDYTDPTNLTFTTKIEQ